MQRSATSLIDLLSELRGDLGSGKRRQPRAGMRVKTRIRLHDRSEHDVWVRDLSVSGANFVSPVKLDPDHQVRLIMSPDGKQHMTCDVIYCRQLQRDLFAVGVKFFL
jgi:hypothetical protein